MLTRDEWRTQCRAQLGKPYIWGADGPEAYDCSGLVQWALAKLGLDPPGDQSAEGLYRFFRKGGRSERVTDAEADLGDIVFFGSDEAITHVALACGDSQMLEAGGGGRATTTIAQARAHGAEVRVRPIRRRSDLVAIFRPTQLGWLEPAPRSTLEAADGFGRYEGAPPLTEWLEDGRHMRLKRPFGYIQENGRDWPVPSETVVDGASIPRVFWSLIGGPFEGRFRDASIVHDFYCDDQSRSWRDTHRIFYEAMCCSGVAPGKAKVLYYAVYRFGPRWELGRSATVVGLEAIGDRETIAAPLPVEGFDAASFAVDAELILATDPDPDAIEALADARAATPAA